MSEVNLLQAAEGPGVLITGANGFLGRHVAQKFCEEVTDGPFVSVSFPDRKHLDLLAGVNHIRDWLYDHPNLDTVVHLAAQCGGIGINREKPGEFLYNNLMMTSNLIEACRLEGIRKFVGIGTVCSYPKFAPVPFREDDLYNGYPEETNAPYGQAKRMQLEMLRAYRKQYGFNGIYLIPVNMAGEYDHFDEAGSHVIPALIKKFHDAKMWDVNKPVTLWGDGSASREFLYAGDCAEAIYLAAIRYDGELPVNIGTGQEITIAELATKVQRVVGHKGDILWDETKPNGQPRRCLDTSRAKELFGFEAKTDLDEILARSYTYYLGTLRD